MLITNAHIVNEGREFDADLLIRNGRIEKIAPQITAHSGVPVFDAKGRTLMPGIIDDQVHFREPGMTHKGDLSTESAAAVAGGTTSLIDMPNTIPNCTTRTELAAKFERAAGRCHANYSFHFGAANDNLEEVKALKPGDCAAVKIFMGASTGNMLVDNPQTLEGIFKHSQLILLTHCEDTPTIKANEAIYRERYGEHPPWSAHPLIRSAEACYKSTELAVGLAKKHDARLHVLHLTTAKELSFFTPGPVKGKRITVEACVHHLSMDDSLYATLGAQIKCNPAIKTAADRVALVKAVMEDRIDVIATDHAPHTIEEKAQGFWKAPSGLPLVQHSLLMLLDLVERGELDLHTVVRKTSHAVAERFNILERGYIREGYWADLTLVDRQAHTTVTRDSLLYKCGWSPLEGHSFPARVDATWVNGELVWNGKLLGVKPSGQRLRFV